MYAELANCECLLHHTVLFAAYLRPSIDVRVFFSVETLSWKMKFKSNLLYQSNSLGMKRVGEFSYPMKSEM